MDSDLNKNGSNVADLYAALHQHMRTRVAGPHSTSPDHELHIYDVSVHCIITDFTHKKELSENML